MKMYIRLLVVVVCLGACSTAQAANVYRWVDKEGKVVYSDIPPPVDVQNAQLKKLDGNTVDVDRVPFATRDAMKKNPVTLYANNCGEPCDKARQLLAKRGIPFSSKNPESSQADADALKKLIGALEVPVLLVGTNPLKGFEAGSWEAALDSAGYPRTAAITPPATVKPAPAPASEPTPAAKPEASSPAAKN